MPAFRLEQNDPLSHTNKISRVVYFVDDLSNRESFRKDRTAQTFGLAHLVIDLPTLLDRRSVPIRYVVSPNLALTTNY